MSQQFLQIAKVVEVNGSKTVGELEASVNDLYRTHRSRKYSIGQIGSIVKIESGDLLIFGVVTSLRMMETLSSNAPSTQGHTDSTNAKWIEIELFGQGRRTGTKESDFDFERGVSTYPLPGQQIFVATFDELRRVYAKPDKATIQVGTASQARGLPVHLLVDDLLGKHFAVLGTTGSGKSCAVTLLLKAILDRFSHAHIVLLDPHDEYRQAFPDHSEAIDPTSLEIPHWLLNFEESVELFVGRSEHAAVSQTNILKDALLKARQMYKPECDLLQPLTVDTPTPYKISDLINAITEAKKPLTVSKAESHDKILGKIETLKNDKRFEFLLRPDDSVKDNLAILLGRLFRMPTFNKPLCIINLSGVPSDVVDVVVSVLCRTLCDFALWNPQRHALPLLLVCEEAHRYAPRNEAAVFQSARNSLARIAKEGRKYGVGLALVTQRPSELSESILSQCNTIIALRMSNEQDQQFIRRALPDAVRSLVDALPAMRTREALVVGEGTTVPVRIVFNELPENARPRSANVPFAQSWLTNDGDLEAVETAVRRWREQDRG